MNIGTPAVEAARSLNGNPHWDVVRAALLEQTRMKMQAVLESAPGSARDDTVGYARALRDLWLSLESATTGAKIQQVKKPGLEK